MKYRLPILLLVGIALARYALGQGAIIDDRYLPGEHMQYRQRTYTTLGSNPQGNISTGQNQTWNIAMPMGSADLTLDYVIGDTIRATYNSLYLPSNRLAGNTIAESSVYYNADSTGLAYRGYEEGYANPTGFCYLSNDLLFPLHFQFGQERRQELHGYYYLNGDTINKKPFLFRSTTRYTGSGSLTIFGHTYPEAVLLERVDSVFRIVQGTLQFGYYKDRKSFYVPMGIGLPVYSWEVDHATGFFTNTLYYRDNITLAGKPLRPRTEAALRISPVPVRDRIQVEGAPWASLGTIQDLHGSILQSFSLSACSSGIEVSTLVPGIYQICLQTRDGVQRKRFVKE